MAINNLLKLFSTIKDRSRAYIPQIGFQKEMKDSLQKVHSKLSEESDELVQVMSKEGQEKKFDEQREF